MLMEMHIRNLKQRALLMMRTEDVARVLESTKLQGKSGFTESFAVRTDLMGLAIGAHGQNIQNARKIDGITNIDLEEATCTFHITGEVPRDEGFSSIPSSVCVQCVITVFVCVFLLLCRRKKP
jgi:fragile X mental retardation protein